MKFSYEPKWRISNDRVRKLDAARVKLNGYCCMTTYQRCGDPLPYFSLETARKIKTTARKIQEGATSLGKGKLNAFDRLVVEDISKNSQIAHHYHEYMYDKNSKMRVGAFISNLFGNSSYSRLLQSVRPRTYPHKDLHRDNELMHCLTSRAIDSDIILNTQGNKYFKGLKSKLQQELKQNKKFVDEFYTKKGVLEEVTDYNFEFASPGSGFSFWEGHNLLAAIDPDRLLCYKQKGKKEHQFYDAFVKLIGIHEVGHGLHEMLSAKTMPLGMRAGPETYTPIIHGPNGEGVALSCENAAIKFLRENKKRFHTSEKDVDRAASNLKTYIPKKLLKVAHDVLEMKDLEERENENFPDSLYRESHEALVNLTGIKRCRDIFSFDDEEFETALQHMTYFFGEKRINSLIQDMKKQRVPEDVRMSALFTGFWCSPEAQKRFLFDLYLPRVMKIRARK